MNENKTPAGLWFAIGVGVALRWVHLAIISPTDLVRVPIIDARFYHLWAQTIARGDIIGDGIFFMSPLYPYLMGLIYALLGSEPIKMMAVQSLLSALTIGGLYHFVRHLLSSQRAGLIAAWGLALYAPAIFYDGTLLTASLSLLISTFLLLTAHRALQTPANGVMARFGLMLGLAALVRPLVLLFPFLWLIEFWRRHKPLPFRSLGWLGIGLCVVLLPVGIRNWIVGGQFSLTAASGGVNFYIGNNPNATGLYWEAPFLTSWEPPYEEEDYRQEASQAVGRQLTTAQASHYWLRQSLDWAINHPGEFLKLWLIKSFYFFNRAEFANNVSLYLGKELSPLLRYNVWGWWLLAPLGMGGLVLLIKREGRERGLLPLLWVLTYFLGNVIFFVSSEYRFPAILGFLTGLGYLGDQILVRIRTGQLAAALRYAVVGLVLLPFVNWRTSFIARGENSRMDWFNIGNTLLKEGQYEQAAERFLRSLEVDPYFSEGLLRLAEAYYRAGQVEKAVEVGKQVGLPQPEEIIHLLQMEALKQAYRSLNTGDMRRAVEEFHFAGWKPAEVEAETLRVRWMEEARQFFQSGELDSALQRFHALARLDSFKEPAFLYNIGFLHWQMGHLDSGEYWARQALARDSLSVPAAYLLARILHATDRQEEAERIINKVNPDTETRKQILADVRQEMDSLLARKQFYEALKAYSRYGKLGFDIEAEDKVRLGQAQIEVGNWETGLRLLSEAEAAFLRDPVIPLYQGKAYLMLGRRDEAIEAFRRCITLQSDNVEARIYLARLYLAKGKVQEAWREMDAISHLEITDSLLSRQYQALYDTIKIKL